MKCGEKVVKDMKYLRGSSPQLTVGLGSPVAQGGFLVKGHVTRVLASLCQSGRLQWSGIYTGRG